MKVITMDRELEIKRKESKDKRAILLAQELLDRREWLTARKTKIHIKDMGTSHIRNVLRCLKGESMTSIPEGWSGRIHKEWIEIFESELSKR